MGLKKLKLNPPRDDYGSQQQRKFAFSFLESLAKDAKITEEQWPIIIRIAEQVYWTTFTDDSGYIPGSMDFTALDDLPKELREELISYFWVFGNWIVQSHIKDYRKDPDSWAARGFDPYRLHEFKISRHAK